MDEFPEVSESSAMGEALATVNATPTTPTPNGVSYGALTQVNAEHDADYWQELRALYHGGKRLLGDDAVMRRLFPAHRDEIEKVYEERKRRAFYVSYASEIVSKIVADLGLDPLTLGTGGDKETAKWDEFYDTFFKDVTPRAGERLSMNALIRERALEALQVRRAWTLVELPGSPSSQFSSRAEQEKAGALNAYAVPLDAESVLDWEFDHDGELEFVLLNFRDQKRPSVTSSRSMITERWVWYDRQKCVVYQVTYRADNPPQEKDIIPMVSEVLHGFGRVPALCLKLPHGLWAMDKLASLAKEHFNKRSALGWAEFQSLFQELYEFLAPAISPGGVIVNELQEDPGRAKAHRRGQGYVQERGSDDKAMFIGPGSESFTHALASCKDIRDEMHRVTHQMALTVDNSAAALQRSGESKELDQAATTVVLQALGVLCREYANSIMAMVAKMRGDKDLAAKWSVTGMTKFNRPDPAKVIEEATGVKLLEIKSETFQRRYQLKVAKSALPDEDEDTIKAIQEELESNITSESMAEDAEADAAVKKVMTE